MTITRSLLLTALVAVTSMPLPAAEPATDVRVLIDVSGSMKDNDPANLRAPALRLLSGLMPVGATSGIWLFAESVDGRLPPGSVDDTWKQRAGAVADAIHSRGQRTDIEAALRVATRDWKVADENTRRSVILLTDGMVDTGSDAASAASRERILGERVAALSAGGAAVHAIALSAQADHELLRSLAIRTGGWYERAENAGQLERLFLRMFEKATQPDTVPINGNRFSVDSSIDEMTVLVFRAPGTPPMRLVAPEEIVHTAAAPGEGVVWRTGNGYDMVTISQPAQGQWLIDGEVDPDNRVLVVTDLKLDVTDLPSYLLPGTELPIAAALTESGERVVREDFLRLVGVNAERQSVNGERRDLIMLDDGDGGDAEAGDGLFGSTLKSGDEEGVLQLKVTADSGTFIREKRFSLEVVWPVTATIEAGAPAQLVITPREDVIDPGTLRVSAKFAPDGGAGQDLTLNVADDGRLRASLPDIDTAAGVQVALSATTLAGDALQMTLPPLPVAPPPPADAAPVDPPPSSAAPAEQASPEAEAADPGAPAETTTQTPPPDWQTAVIVTIAANLVAGALLFALLWWRRRQRQRQMDSYEAALAAPG